MEVDNNVSPSEGWILVRNKDRIRKGSDDDNNNYQNKFLV